MIIDQILDRKDFNDYTPRNFYSYCMEDGPGYGWNIARAMDSGTNKDVQIELCKYIQGNGYNPQICEYVNSVNWL